MHTATVPFSLAHDANFFEMSYPLNTITLNHLGPHLPDVPPSSSHIILQ
jgi:hypothetical protein